MESLEAVECAGSAFAVTDQAGWPVHVFDVKDVGLDREGFIRDVRPSFDRTSWDEYDVANRRFAFLQTVAGTPAAELDAVEAILDGRERVRRIDEIVRALPTAERQRVEQLVPHRRRAMRKYEVTRNGSGRWRVQPLADGTFSQAVSDYRARTREFQLVERDITYSPAILTLIASAAESVRRYHPDTARLDVALHQMTIVARPRQPGHPAPEGVHQDGVDFIVSALIVERHGVTGATSRVRHGPAGDPILEIELAPGQGIFQADAGSPLWHEVSPIDLEPGVDLGHRMAFGLDLNRC